MSSPTDIVESLAFGPDGDVLYSADRDGNVDAWDVSNPRTVRHLAHVVQEGQSVYVLAVSAKDKLLAAGGQDGTIRLWDISDPLRPRPVGAPVIGHHQFPVSALAFAPDGKVFASGGEDQEVTLWNVDATKGLTRARPARTQSNTILALAFNPAGDTLAAADGDGSVCLYEASSGRYIGSTSCLLGHSSGNSDLTGIRALQFTGDGRQLVSGGDGNPVVAWNALLWDESNGAVPALTAEVCRIAERNLTLREWNAVFAGTPLVGHPRRTCTTFR